MKNNIFVFAVCGVKEHIDTLHFSIKCLMKFTKFQIFVVTDVERNEIEIIHHKIIDIKTPPNYNHHQASIFLKTGLHKFLPKGNNYCYLDSDVIALSAFCDQIFDLFIAPIRFAPDHCKIQKFSPHAVNCGCSIKWSKDRDIFNTAIKEMVNTNNEKIVDHYLIDKQKELQFELELIKKTRIKKIFIGFKYFISFSKFKLNQNFYFDKKNRVWHLSSGEKIFYEFNVTKIETVTGFRYSRIKQQWLNKDGINIWDDHCNHLAQFIFNTFNIKIRKPNWQHWNGGVFLFNDLSYKFLESWHLKTLKIFELSDWKTRDQGTLIATAWEFNLSCQPVLDKKWNFIADFQNNGLVLDSASGGISDNNLNNIYHPIFVHVYHNWGNTEWSIWKWIMNKIDILK